MTWLHDDFDHVISIDINGKTFFSTYRRTIDYGIVQKEALQIRYAKNCCCGERKSVYFVHLISIPVWRETSSEQGGI